MAYECRCIAHDKRKSLAPPAKDGPYTNQPHVQTLWTLSLPLAPLSQPFDSQLDDP